MKRWSVIIILSVLVLAAVFLGIATIARAAGPVTEGAIKSSVHAPLYRTGDIQPFPTPDVVTATERGLSQFTIASAPVIHSETGEYTSHYVPLPEGGMGLVEMRVTAGEVIVSLMLVLVFVMQVLQIVLERTK